MLQTIIRACLAVLLLILTLGVLAFLGGMGLNYWKARSSASYLAHTTCGEFMTAVKAADEPKLQRVVNAMEHASSQKMEYVDKSLFQSGVSFRELMATCMELPSHTLRGVMVDENSTTLAARVTDLYNTVLGEKQLRDGTAQPVNMPDAEGGYVHVPKTVSQTAPAATEVKEDQR